MARPRHRLGLRTRLAIGFGALAGLLCVALSVVVGELARDRLQAQTARYLVRMALEYRERIDNTFAQRLADLDLLARIEGTPRYRRERVDEVVRARGLAWIGFIDAAGRVQTASNGILEGSDLSGRPWLRGGVSRATLVPVNDNFVDLVIPLEAGRGLIAAQMDLGFARTLRSAIEASADPALPVDLMLIASDGTVLSGPAGLEGARIDVAKLGAGASLLQRWPDRERYLVATSGSRPGAPFAWSVLARTRADAALSSAAVLQRAILWAGLVLALAGIVVGWTLATRHARPLETLTQAALEIASGNERAHLPPLDDNREVFRLAEALRSMLARLRTQAESLRAAQERLQQRVHERTAELVRAQAQLQLEIAEASTARDELARAHAQLELALEASAVALFDYDVASQQVSLNAGWSHMLGAPAVQSRLSMQDFAELVPPGARERMQRELGAALAGESDEFRLEHPVLRRDGKVICVAAAGRITERDADHRACRVIGTYRRLT